MPLQECGEAHLSYLLGSFPGPVKASELGFLLNGIPISRGWLLRLDSRRGRLNHVTIVHSRRRNAVLTRLITLALTLHSQTKGSCINLAILQHGGAERRWITACSEVSINISSSQCDKAAVLHRQRRTFRLGEDDGIGGESIFDRSLAHYPVFDGIMGY